MLLNFCEIFFYTEDSIDAVYAQGGKGQNTTSKCIFKISHWQKITLLLKFRNCNIKNAVFMTLSLTLPTKVASVWCSKFGRVDVLLNVFNHLMHNVPKRSDTL